MAWNILHVANFEPVKMLLQLILETRVGFLPLSWFLDCLFIWSTSNQMPPIHIHYVAKAYVTEKSAMKVQYIHWQVKFYRDYRKKMALRYLYCIQSDLQQSLD